MSVDCKGCLVVENKDVFGIVHKVSEGLKDLMRKESGLTGFALYRSDEYKQPRAELLSWGESISMTFIYKGEARDLKIHFGCDCDLAIYPEIQGVSCVWFSLGCWGSSELLMRTVLDSVRQYGKVYIDVNDSDDTDFEEI